jgi:hypothetical protein
VRVDRSSVKYGGKCFLVFDEGFEIAHRHVKMVKEVRALLEGVEISTNTGNILSGIRHSSRYRTSILNYRISSLRYRTSK